jgi:predicted RNase H-like nuclease (RuvC/YqgF family)
MSKKMTVLNIRMSLDEKLEIKGQAELSGKTISSYARDLLFSPNNTDDEKDNTKIIQEKDERIFDLKEQIEDYKKQIDQLHTIILATQKDNQLLLEQKQKRWWQIWK